MARVNALLLALIVACALGVVTSQDKARMRFGDLEGEQDKAKKLDEEWTQLQLEQSTWATNQRVDAIASRQLGMRAPDPDTTVIIGEDGKAVGSRS
jgi:cell division protein FtsL